MKKKNQRHLASLALGPGWRGFWTLILTGHGSIWHHWRALHCTWAKFLNSFLATVLLQRPQLLHVSRLMYHGFWDFRTIWIQRSSYPCPWKWEKPSESVKMFYKKHISPCANHSKSDSAFFLFSLGDSQVKMTGMHVVFLWGVNRSFGLIQGIQDRVLITWTRTMPEPCRTRQMNQTEQNK